MQKKIKKVLTKIAGKKKLTVRKAMLEDAVFIHMAIQKYAAAADLLIKPLGDIYSQIREYFICEINGKPAGLIALHVYWSDMAEIRSFVVEKENRMAGAGGMLLKAAMAEAKKMGITKVFALTKIPDYFRKHGFKDEEKAALPQKIWKDCLNCPKFPNCDESAVLYDFNGEKG
ncbi:MAG: N-acetyltransferase [Candidatus Goldbacteria bacterium]|nr:N-acetyltransferase [Candidatus Goldiibacteriota bacterium]